MSALMRRVRELARQIQADCAADEVACGWLDCVAMAVREIRNEGEGA